MGQRAGPRRVLRDAVGADTVNRAEAYAALDDLYAQLPELECKGRCHDSCTIIDMSEIERERIADTTGVKIPLPIYPLRKMFETGEPPRCPALGPLNTCRVYEVRPFLCRAWGMVLTNPDAPHRGPMMCDHGCIPDGVIDSVEFIRIMSEIERVSAEITGVDRRPPWAR